MPTACYTRYQRIRIENDDDIARLYPLIIDYLRRPTLAESVTELVLTRIVPDSDGSDLGSYIADLIHEINEKESERVVSQISPFLATIRSLGTVHDRLDEWLRILTWMDPNVKGPRDRAHDPRRLDIKHSFKYRNSLFAHHAAAMLIALCPNIERLTVRDPGFNSPIKDVLIKNNYNQLPGRFLQKLKHVSLLATDDVFLVDDRLFTTMDFLGLFRLFHRLPDVQSIDVGGIAEDVDDGGWSMHPPYTANYSTIHITHSDLSSAFLTALIGAPKTLRDFKMSVGRRATIDDGFSEMRLRDLGMTLYLQKDTLEKLDLDVDDYVYVGGEETESDIAVHAAQEAAKLEWHYGDVYFLLDATDSPGPLPLSNAPLTRTYGSTIGSLHDFAALTHLAIGIKTLLGPTGEPPFRLVNALPNSLQSLVLRGYEAGVNSVHDAHVQELMNKRREALPNLSEIQGVDVVIPNSRNVQMRNLDRAEAARIFWKPEHRDNDWLEVQDA